jgi:hypothetical protein
MICKACGIDFEIRHSIPQYDPSLCDRCDYAIAEFQTEPDSGVFNIELLKKLLAHAEAANAASRKEGYRMLAWILSQNRPVSYEELAVAFHSPVLPGLSVLIDEHEVEQTDDGMYRATNPISTPDIRPDISPDERRLD